jgi:type I restriction enzyme S subunit
MMPELLLHHFDRINEAPDAIPRLRRFILDLAVRGKLVEQDPQDEPASELLKRIQAEKARLGLTQRRNDSTKGKKIDCPGDLAVLLEAPFDVPIRWEWVRIRQVTSDRGQAIPYKDFTYIDVTAINKEVGCIADAKVITPADAPSRARKRVCTGDVLYSCVRPYLLNIAVVENDIQPAPIASTAFAVINGFGLILPRYLWITLRSPFMVECVEAKMRGQAYPAINDSDFAMLPFPLPPLAEQHRIVAKVDELMALCDQLETARNERETQRDRLVVASLNRIGISAVDSANNAASFHLNHLPRLTTRPEHIKQLRQAILNLAVRGRLVPQDPQDEPASELLKRIQTEKVRLVKEGVQKKEANLPEVDLEQAPFDLPDGWIWSRFPELGTFGRGKSKHRPRNDSALFEGGTHLLIQTGDVARSQGVIKTYTNKYNEVGLAQSFKWPTGSLCITIAANIADSGILSFDACFPDSVVGFIPASIFPNARYFEYFVRTAKANLLAFAPATAQKNINIEILNSVMIPLPPLVEQHRIVAKVDELMALCDQLEAQLTTTATDSRRLLEAVLRDALDTSAMATG